MTTEKLASVQTGIVGILLAGGRGTRFDSSGRQNKLLQLLSDGRPVAVHAARSLRFVLSSVVAVVPESEMLLQEELQATGCSTCFVPSSRAGLSASLSCGLNHSAEAAGWIIALADMPFVQPETVAAVASALSVGADIAAPFCEGRRGNPVGFSRKHLPALLALDGDAGAAGLLKLHPVERVEVRDAGVLIDIDTVDDLHRFKALAPDSFSHHWPLR